MQVLPLAKLYKIEVKIEVMTVTLIACLVGSACLTHAPWCRPRGGAQLPLDVDAQPVMFCYKC